MNRLQTADKSVINRGFCSSAGSRTCFKEKKIQRQIDVGTLISSQRQRALLVPVTNRWSTAGFVSPSVFRDMPGIKKVYKDKKGVVPLVGSQKERALLVPLIYRSQIADGPIVNRGFCSSVGLHRISLVRAFRKTFKRRFFDALEIAKYVGLFLRDTVLLANSPARPRPAAPPCVPTRPARGMSEF